MATEEKGQEKLIVFVAFEGVTALDLIGPVSALGHLGGDFKAVVAADTTKPFFAEGDIIYFGATKTFDEVQRPFGIVVPGGGMSMFKAMANPAIQKFLRENAPTAEFVASVCTGALILAAAGLLEGRKATTHWAYWPELEKFGAKFEHKRWVEDGKFITSAGVSAGIDMSIYLASKLTNVERAKEIQKGMEYDPDPPFGPVDWTGALESVPQPENWSDESKAGVKEALALKPELFDRLMA